MARQAPTPLGEVIPPCPGTLRPPGVGQIQGPDRDGGVGVHTTHGALGSAGRPWLEGHALIEAEGAEPERAVSAGEEVGSFHSVDISTHFVPRRLAPCLAGWVGQRCPSEPKAPNRHAGGEQ